MVEARPGTGRPGAGFPGTRRAAPRAEQRRSLIPVWVISLVVVAIGTLWLGTTFLPLALEDDGFRSQLGTALYAFGEGEVLEFASESWLIFVHLGRALVVAPFVGVEAQFGPAGQLALLMLVLGGAVSAPYRAEGRWMTLVPLALPLVLSGRGVLVSCGAAYLALYLLHERGKPWMLWFGALCANLSSASVLMALLLLLFARPRQPLAQRQWFQRSAVVALLGLSLAVSVADKIAGFQGGETGYEAQGFGAGNVFLTALSRATLLISFSEGQLARALVYSAVAAILLFNLTVKLRGQRSKGMRRVLLCGLPGIFLEGLGVVGLLVPLTWVFAGFDPTGRTVRGRRQP